MLSHSSSSASRQRYFLRVVGRLREDTTAEVASKEVSAIVASLECKFADYASSGQKLFVMGQAVIYLYLFHKPKF